MAKFCGNCGTQLDDDAKVCGNCGTPLEGNFSNISGIGVVNENNQILKKKAKKTVKIISILLISAVVIGTAINVAWNFTGNRGFVRKTMSAFKSYDINTLISFASEMYYCGDENNMEYYFEEAVGGYIDYFEETVGHNYKISYDINEIYTLSERRQEEILENIESSYPEFDTNLIHEIVVADITVMAKQDDRSIENDLKITMTKEGKEWKLLYLDGLYN